MRRFLRRVRLAPRVAYFYALYICGGLKSVCNRLRMETDPAPILKLFGATIGSGTIVYPGIVIHAAVGDFSNLVVGCNCRIMTEAFLDLTDRVVLEDNSSVGIRCALLTHVNAARSPLAADIIEPQSGPVVLRHGAVTYTGSVVLHGVTLGECCVVGAGSVVSRDVAPRTMVLGNPARKIRDLGALTVL